MWLSSIDNGVQRTVSLIARIAAAKVPFGIGYPTEVN